MEFRKVKIDLLNPAEYNPRVDLQPGDPEYEKLRKSIQQFGNVEPIIWNEKTGHVVGGHQRLKVLVNEGETETEVSVVNLSISEEKALNVALNKISGEWDNEKLEDILQELLEDEDIDVTLTGFDMDEIDNMINDILEPANKREPVDSNLFDTFVVPPFSILDTRQGYWKDRKKHWLDFGIKSESGREDNLLFPESLKMGNSDNGTSIFDPVLCEIVYRWFNITGGQIFDPFAGGSVRGVIANLNDYPYTGIDLRQEQIEENYRNAKELGLDIDKLKWICDDSLNLDNHIKDDSVDLLFTCPPYFDLEVYSDDERDISNMSFDDFSDIFSDIMKKASAKLRENRFAVVVLSDVRNKDGYYRDLTGLLKRTFSECGLRLYNDIILLNVAGTAALRSRRSMRNRKVIRVHQQVLVFYKGDPGNIQKNFEELTELEEETFEDEEF